MQLDPNYGHNHGAQPMTPVNQLHAARSLVRDLIRSLSGKSADRFQAVSALVQLDAALAVLERQLAGRPPTELPAHTVTDTPSTS